MDFQLNKTWDDQIPLDKAQINISIQTDAPNNALRITLDAPFYDDPKLPESTVPGRVDGLWDYEVVEVFILGEDQQYLEIELGPRGHYLLYYLHGVKNVTKPDILLKYYLADIYDDSDGGKRWKGDAVIPLEFLPPNVSKMNAFAIHKSGENRTYMALYPVPQGKFTQPDFHRLEYFEPFQIVD